MTNIIMHGCGGKMGGVIASLAAGDDDCQIVAGIDTRAVTAAFPTYTDISDCHEQADVIIDFSTAAAVPALIDYASKKNVPVVVCTTGLSDETLGMLKKASQHVAVLKSANMSLGVNLIIDLVQRAATKLYDAGFDIEVIEKHHNQKIDAPSGTALAIADAINHALDDQLHFVHDRSHTRAKRERTEIGLHALRGGTIVGEHDVVFAGRDEIIEINHKAMSREIFAVGAMKAAKFLAGKPAGLYSMKDVVQ